MQAMILAAGFGTRLLPHSLVRPKPLFPILNTPLLLLVVRRLRNSGFSRILVNCHHLVEQFEEALRDEPFVTLLREDVILGTGGGLRAALPLLSDEPLLVTNGDIYHSVDLAGLYHQHLQSPALATLATIDHARFNSVCVQNGRVTGFDGAAGSGKATFTGIHVIDPEVLEPVQKNGFSCIIDRYREVLKQGGRIAAQNVNGCYWTDMGTPEAYLKLHEGLLAGSIPRWPEFGDISAPFCIDRSAHVPDSVHLKGWVTVGGASIGENVHIENSVVWEGVDVAAGSVVKNRIISSSAALEI